MISGIITSWGGPDEGEPPASAEPFLPPESGPHAAHLEDLTLSLVSEARGLAAQLHPLVTEQIGNLVRAMNCYYSNLIEGHYTHPIDIERALKRDLVADPKRRALQLEAAAHIAVQAELDAAPSEAEGAPAALSWAFAEGLHQRFCNLLPEELLWVDDPVSGARLRVVPGAPRHQHVQVGRHVAPSPGSLPRFLARFDQAYAPSRLSRLRRIIAVGAAHHRFLWVHPFLDGNGRVARLMSHAALREAGVGNALWSVARGLARRSGEYKRLLMEADAPRAGDLDGRGALSESALARLCVFFLSTCVDQVRFMAGLIQPSALRARVEAWAATEARAGRLHARAGALLREVLIEGEVPRGRVPEVVNLGERAARNVVAGLIERGALTAASPKAPLRLAIRADFAEAWFPGLYPAMPDAPPAS